MSTPDTDEIYSADFYKLIDLYFRGDKNLITRYIIDSYENGREEFVEFIKNDENNIVYTTNNNGIVYEYRLSYRNIIFKPPIKSYDNGIPIFPIDTIRNSSDYVANMYADVECYVLIKNLTTDIVERRLLGSQKAKHIHTVPNMIKSSTCNLSRTDGNDSHDSDFDGGGYFITNGVVRYGLTHDRICNDKPFTMVGKAKGKSSRLVTTRIMSRTRQNIQLTHKINIVGGLGQDIKISIPLFVTGEGINVYILFRALGVTCDQELVNVILMGDRNNELEQIIKEGLKYCIDQNKQPIYTKNHAYDYIISTALNEKILKKYKLTHQVENESSQHLYQYLDDQFVNNFIPHTEANIMKKIYELGRIVKKHLLTCIDNTLEDSRDTYEYKRLQTMGDMCWEVSKKGHKKMQDDSGKHIANKLQDSNVEPDDPVLNVIGNINQETLFSKVKKFIKSGKYTSPSLSTTDALNQISYTVRLCNLRAIHNLVKHSTMKRLTKPRRQHPSVYGFICPCQTPEHQKIGFIRSMAITSQLTVFNRSTYALLKEYLMKSVKTKFKPQEVYGSFMVFLNAEWIGLTQDPIKIRDELDLMRFVGALDIINVSVVVNIQKQELCVYCDASRFIRPILRVIDNQLLLTPEMVEDSKHMRTMNEFTKKYPGVVDYLDMEKTPFVHIAEDIKVLRHEREKMIYSFTKINEREIKEGQYTKNRYDNGCYKVYDYCEWPAPLLFGEVAVKSPYSNHNYSVRNMYHFSQDKQAKSMPHTAFRNLMINNTMHNWRPQSQLVVNKAAKYVNQHMIPNGENIMVGVMCYEYNQEDSQVFNKTGLDRGLFGASKYTKYKESIMRDQKTTETEKFGVPNPAKVYGTTGNNYGKLDDNGIVRPGTLVEAGDAIIGKITSNNDSTNGYANKDASIIYRYPVPGIVDKVFEGRTNDYPEVQVTISTNKQPTIGDKFCSGHGQKGTISAILPMVSMPYTKDGMRIDVLINPHGLNGRMTLGQFLETVTGKYGALEGMQVDGTPFENYDVYEIIRLLEQHGYEGSGEETLYDGDTGKKIQAKIFMGPVYYKPLKHMVDDKYHCRGNHGFVTMITRQPTDGRNKGGGQKLGEMEADAIRGHGAMFFTYEHMLYDSDVFLGVLCKSCGIFGQRVVNKDSRMEVSSHDTYQCLLCGKQEMSYVALPYTLKTLIQEMNGMGIDIRLHTK